MPKDTIRESVDKFINARPARPTINDYEISLESQDRLTPIVEEAIDKARVVRLGHTVVFYIAGALTGVSEDIKQRYVDLSELISGYKEPGATMFGYAPHLHGTDPVKHLSVSANEVRDIDYLWSSVIADAHFNLWDPIAHGNAIEEGWAEAHQIPSMYLTPETMITSRLVRGMHNIMGTLVYADFQTDCLLQVQDFLDETQNRLTNTTPQ